LVAEIEKRRGVREEVVKRGTGAGVRIVSGEED
jgi:hypothetical protein